MIHYMTLGTNNLTRARGFYDPVMATLGLIPLMSNATEIGYGHLGDNGPGLYVTTPFDRKPASHGNGTMLALTAATPAQVDAFHAAALAHGGTDDGAPGLRYSPTFYACYVRDPDGNKLSAVSDRAENARPA
ncbi:MAG: VOC family protein [bacterium]